MSETSPRLFIVSPHLDDAVFSCGELLTAHPDAAVCTVFAAPPEQEMHTEWNKESGFADAHDAIHQRTIEDNRALEETIYRTTANTLLMSLGLHHNDHVRVFEACCEILPRLSHLVCFGYEEAIHRRTPGVVQARLANLPQCGIVATPAQPSAGHTIDAACRA
ncbi:MAG: No significant database matches [uncultured Paraburkholderia sp.]|nr:MAG: No significant database matches [uncultured Paraburkholderia sp.]CAH2929849.1 MAG: No significant database matches [uncultured Paraburkholderia sp.]